MLGEIDRATFELAQDVESGRVALDLPDEPRPLFERPTQASTKPIIETAPTNTDLQSPEKLYGIAPRPEMEPGTESQPVRLPHARRSQVELKTFEILDGDRLGTHVIGTIQAKDAESAIKAARSKHKGIIRIKVRNLLA